MGKVMSRQKALLQEIKKKLGIAFFILKQIIFKGRFLCKKVNEKVGLRRATPVREKSLNWDLSQEE